METTLSKKQEEKLFKVLGGEDESIRKAIEFIEEKHAGQYRKSGEPYVVHPIEVAITLAELGMDKSTIIAGLMHDVLEDTETTYEEIKQKFGKEVADLVEGVTKLSKIHFKDIQTQKAENYRKLILAFSKDLRVIFIKLADRLHNMKTLQCFSREKQVRIAKETLEIYLPIANRLGLWKVKTELEDLCFMYLYPKEYEERVMEIKGRDVTGLPKVINISNKDVTEALEDVISSIVNAIKTTLERTPPELASDIAERGITLAGGGSLLRNLNVRIEQETNIKTRYCEDPITAVARGVGKALDNIELIRKASMV